MAFGWGHGGRRRAGGWTKGRTRARTRGMASRGRRRQRYFDAPARRRRADGIPSGAQEAASAASRWARRRALARSLLRSFRHPHRPLLVATPISPPASAEAFCFRPLRARHAQKRTLADAPGGRRREDDLKTALGHGSRWPGQRARQHRPGGTHAGKLQRGGQGRRGRERAKRGARRDAVAQRGPGVAASRRVERAPAKTNEGGSARGGREGGDERGGMEGGREGGREGASKRGESEAERRGRGRTRRRMARGAGGRPPPGRRAGSRWGERGTRGAAAARGARGKQGPARAEMQRGHDNGRGPERDLKPHRRDSRVLPRLCRILRVLPHPQTPWRAKCPS